MCATVARLLSAGPHIARALDPCCAMAIDFSMRNLRVLRADLRSGGQRKAITFVYIRSFVRQMAVAHRGRLEGTDPTLPCTLADAPSSSNLPATALAACDASQRRTRIDRSGGSAKMSHHNSQHHAYMSVHAPSRPMTNDEITQVRARSAVRWEGVVC